MPIRAHRAGWRGNVEWLSAEGEGVAMALDTDDLLVTIDHPFGRIEVPLTAWMAIGPGPRPLLHPIAVRSRSTGQQLPLTVIPLQYRNDEESRRLIADGTIESPWPTTD
jgi:hypothetical protein